MKEKYSNFRGVEKIEILKISINEGDGTPDDPIYREVFYCTLNGKIIGKESEFPLRKFAGG
jgi:hypothetical protein